jgi:homogentisate 1,2-dioxygenase
MFERRVVGKVPRKHHIQLRDEQGTLMHEECITRDGFEGPYTIAYHQRAPHTQSLAEVGHGWKAPQAVPGHSLAKRHYKTQELKRVAGAPLDARVPLLFNADVTLGVVHPTEPDPVYFSNADGDDLLYIHEGSGVVRSLLGDLRFEAQDYVFVPRGMLHRFIPDKGVAQYWLSMELKGGLHLPRQWRNDVGQLRMDAPYSHRDFVL